MQARFPANNAYKHKVASSEDVQSDLAKNFRARILCPDTFCHRNVLDQPSERFHHELLLATDIIKKKMAMASKLMSANISYDQYVSEVTTIGIHPDVLIQPIDFPILTLGLLTREILFNGQNGGGVDDDFFFRAIKTSDVKKFTKHVANLDRHDTRLAFTEIFRK